MTVVYWVVPLKTTDVRVTGTVVVTGFVTVVSNVLVCVVVAWVVPVNVVAVETVVNEVLVRPVTDTDVLGRITTGICGVGTVSVAVEVELVEEELEEEVGMTIRLVASVDVLETTGAEEVTVTINTELEVVDAKMELVVVGTDELELEVELDRGIIAVVVVVDTACELDEEVLEDDSTLEVKGGLVEKITVDELDRGSVEVEEDCGHWRHADLSTFWIVVTKQLLASPDGGFGAK